MFRNASIVGSGVAVYGNIGTIMALNCDNKI